VSRIAPPRRSLGYAMLVIRILPHLREHDFQPVQPSTAAACWIGGFGAPPSYGPVAGP
jgi:hypothetical protein